jgi:SpoVK/Ycf46/Vps4 family AAA+-type ATPase
MQTPCLTFLGTGKTSLCKALAQKVSIRNATRFHSTLLFEVNAHSLFSKWFSESGKLVMKLFNHISDVAEDNSCLVVLLIDEVESIANARSSAAKSGEPGDAVRVVNAVLTSLDSLKRKSNVLVLCTSNMMQSLDEVSLLQTQHRTRGVTERLTRCYV